MPTLLSTDRKLFLAVMAKKAQNVVDLGDRCVLAILRILLADFIGRGLSSRDLDRGYPGLPPTSVKSASRSDGCASDIDFDLAWEDLEKAKLIGTGPMQMYDNPPNSPVFMVGFYSKREFSYLTTSGYKAATKMGGPRSTKRAVQHVHITGSTFHQSPVGIGDQVSQGVTISAGDSEAFQILREEIARVVENEQKKELALTKLESLESAIDKPTRIQRYTELVGLLSDHITVLSFLLTPLFSRLMQ